MEAPRLTERPDMLPLRDQSGISAEHKIALSITLAIRRSAALPKAFESAVAASEKFEQRPSRWRPASRPPLSSASSSSAG